MCSLARAASLHLDDLLDAQAQSQPALPAIEAPGFTPLTYAALARQTHLVHRTLRELGIARDDRVALVIADGPLAAVAFLSICGAAATAPLNPAYRQSELAFYLEDLRARAIVVEVGASPDAREVARKLGIAVLDLIPSETIAGQFELRGERSAAVAAPESERSPDDVALVLHTSGTTARPKIVPLTHANLCASAEHIVTALALDSSDRCLNVMPLFHVHGLIGALLASLTAGGAVICAPGFQAPRFFEWLASMLPTWYTAVPTMHQAIADRSATHVPYPLRSTLRLIRSSSAALPPTLMARLEHAFGVPVIEAYGMTEAAHQIASNPLPPLPRKPGSIGRPAGPEVAVLGPDHHHLGAHQVGELALRGPNVTRGYVNHPQANAIVNGWFRTGDQGYYDDEGYLYLTGRLKELINCGGEKIAPREIDDVLLEHPEVAQVVTFGMPDTRLGEVVAAAVVARPNAAITERQLRHFVATRVAFFKVPRRIVFLEELPKGPTGKLQRIGLAERLGLPEPPPHPTEDATPPDATALRIAAFAAEILEVPSVDPKFHFLDAGGDSVTGAMLVSRLRDTMGVDITLLDLFDAPSLAALMGIVREREPSATPTAEAAQAPPAIEALNSGGHRLPIFFLHAATEGDGFYSCQLGLALGPDQPFYGFAPLGLEDTALPETVEDIAETYVARVRERQAVGPYRLCGYCVSGPIVLEMAAQLRAAGEAVTLVAVIESVIQNTGPRLRAFGRTIDALSPMVGLSRKGRAELVLAGRRLAGYRLREIDASSARHQRVRALYHRAIAAYVPRSIDAPLVQFHAQECRPHPGWQHVSTCYSTAVLPGDHDTCVTLHSRSLATALAKWLDVPVRGHAAERSAV